MQLVINIDDKLYEIIKNPKKLETMYHAGRLCEAVRNGTPLPKGHGKIGDLTKLYNEIDARNKGKDKGKYTGILALVGFANTIIEADKN